MEHKGEKVERNRYICVAHLFCLFWSLDEPRTVRGFLLGNNTEELEARAKNYAKAKVEELRREYSAQRIEIKIAIQLIERADHLIVPYLPDMDNIDDYLRDREQRREVADFIKRLEAAVGGSQSSLESQH